MLKLYLVRHGETEMNRLGIVQGSGVDSSLNETGLRQAGALYQYYKDTKFNALFTSELKRTHQTVASWCGNGLSCKPDAGINEMNWGILEGAEATSEMRSLFIDMKRRWSAGELGLKIEGGESPLEAWERAKPFFDRLRQTYEEGSFLICTHGRISCVILSQLLGYGLENMNLFNHTNTGVNIVHLYRNGRAFAEKLNDTSHLAGISALTP
jgi:probable phosphoglycerate mutase